MQGVPDFLVYFAPSLPVALVWLVGVAWALVTLPRHQGVSVTALLGFGVLLLSLIGGNVLTWWIIFQQRNAGGWNAAQTGLTLSVLGFSRAVVSSIGYALLLVAIFGWRRGAAPRRPRLALGLPADEDEDEDGPPGDPAGIRTPGR